MPAEVLIPAPVCTTICLLWIINCARSSHFLLNLSIESNFCNENNICSYFNTAIFVERVDNYIEKKVQLTSGIPKTPLCS